MNQENNNFNNQIQNGSQNVGSVNLATQQFQTGVNNNIVQNQQNNMQQPLNYNSNNNNQQYNNIIPEKLKKYRKILHNDSVVLLIISTIAMITGLIFAGASSSDSAIDLFMESLFYFIFLIIIVENKKTTRKFIGILAIIVSAFMICFAIINKSLFDVMYFILSIIYIIHSVIYLNNFKGYMPIKEHNEKTKLGKLKYISLILIVLCPVVPIFSIIFSLTSIESFMIIFALSLSSLIIDIILIIKKVKSVLVYVCLLFSILLTIVIALYIPSYISYLKEKTSNQDSDEYKQSVVGDLLYRLESTTAYYLEYGIIPSSSEINEDKFIVTRKDLEDAIKKYNETHKVYDSDYESPFDDKNLKGFDCTGYMEAKRDLTEYNDCISRYSTSDESVYNELVKSCVEIYSNDYVVKAYVKCNGKYKYQTEGFDSSKLK